MGIGRLLQVNCYVMRSKSPQTPLKSGTEGDSYQFGLVLKVRRQLQQEKVKKLSIRIYLIEKNNLICETHIPKYSI